MKIVYCIPKIHTAGGMERVLSVKANWLVERGYQVYIITTDSVNCEKFYCFDSRIRVCDLGIKYYRQKSRSVFIKPIFFVYNAIKHRIRLAKILRRINADYVISMFNNEMEFLPKIKDGSKKILEFHFSISMFQYNQRPGILSYVDKLLFKSACKNIRDYDKFVVLTDEDRLMWQAQQELSNIVTICNPVSFEGRYHMADLTSKKVIAVGRLTKQKRFKFLIKVWSLLNSTHSGWTLHIYGQGEEFEDLDKQIKQLHLENEVYLEGNVKDIQSVYLSSSIMCVTSLYEGLPMCMIEAMSMGIPIISCDFSCGPKDLIKQCENGFIVGFNDEKEFARKLLLLMNNDEERRRMGEASYARALEYSIDNVMCKWENLFTSQDGQYDTDSICI